MIPGEQESVLEDSEIQPGSVIADRYRVERVLGAGSMGTVCLATDQLLNDTVVSLKILQAHLTSDTLSQKRFIREVELMNSVSHPNVVRTYEAGVHKGRTYFTMEFVHGLPVDQLPLNKVLDIEVLTSLLLQICRGLDAVHKQGIIHRDLKPENILVTEDLVPKIADFGVARRQSSKLTQAEAIIGSPGYLAPEVWQGLEPTQAIDFYALGVILFELTTQTILFDSDQPASLMWMHINKLPPRIRDIAPEFPQWLDDLVWSMLAKHPLDRPASAEAIIEYINLSLEQEKNGLSERPNGHVSAALGTLQARTNDRIQGEWSKTSELPLPPTGWEPIPMEPELADLLPDDSMKKGKEEPEAPPLKESVSAIFAKERVYLIKKVVLFGLAAIASSVMLLICALIIEAVGSLSDKEPKVKPPWADLREQYKDKKKEEKKGIVASLFTPDLWREKEKEKPKTPWANLTEQFAQSKPDITPSTLPEQPRPQPPAPPPTQPRPAVVSAPEPVKPPWADLTARFGQLASEPGKSPPEQPRQSPALTVAKAPEPKVLTPTEAKTPWADLRSEDEKTRAAQVQKNRANRPIRDFLLSMLPGDHAAREASEAQRQLISSINAKGISTLSYSAARKTAGVAAELHKPASPATLVPSSAKTQSASAPSTAVRWFDRNAKPQTESRPFEPLLTGEGAVNIPALKQRFDLPQESVASVVQLSPDAISEMSNLNLASEQEEQLTAKLELRMKSSEVRAELFALDNPWQTKRASLEWQFTGQIKRLEEAKSYVAEQLSSAAKLYVSSVKEFEGLNEASAVEAARRYTADPTVQSLVTQFDQLNSVSPPDASKIREQRALILSTISPLLEVELGRRFVTLTNVALLFDSLEFAGMQLSCSLDAVKKPITAEPEALKVERERLATELAQLEDRLNQLATKLPDREETLLRALAIAYRYSS